MFIVGNARHYWIEDEYRYSSNYRWSNNKNDIVDKTDISQIFEKFVIM
jgi:hypothetical protein